MNFDQVLLLLYSYSQVCDSSLFQETIETVAQDLTYHLIFFLGTHSKSLKMFFLNKMRWDANLLLNSCAEMKSLVIGLLICENEQVSV